MSSVDVSAQASLDATLLATIISFLALVGGVAAFWLRLNKSDTSSDAKPAPPLPVAANNSKPANDSPPAGDGISLSKKKRDKKKRAAANRAAADVLTSRKAAQDGTQPTDAVPQARALMADAAVATDGELNPVEPEPVTATTATATSSEPAPTAADIGTTTTAEETGEAECTAEGEESKANGEAESAEAEECTPDTQEAEGDAEAGAAAAAEEARAAFEAGVEGLLVEEESGRAKIAGAQFNAFKPLGGKEAGGRRELAKAQQQRERAAADAQKAVSDAEGEARCGVCREEAGARQGFAARFVAGEEQAVRRQHKEASSAARQQVADEEKRQRVDVGAAPAVQPPPEPPAPPSPPSPPAEPEKAPPTPPPLPASEPRLFKARTAMSPPSPSSPTTGRRQGTDGKQPVQVAMVPQGFPQQHQQQHHLQHAMHQHQHQHQHHHHHHHHHQHQHHQHQHQHQHHHHHHHHQLQHHHVHHQQQSAQRPARRFVVHTGKKFVVEWDGGVLRVGVQAHTQKKEVFARMEGLEVVSVNGKVPSTEDQVHLLNGVTADTILMLGEQGSSPTRAAAVPPPQQAVPQGAPHNPALPNSQHVPLPPSRMVPPGMYPAAPPPAVMSVYPPPQGMAPPLMTQQMPPPPAMSQVHGAPPTPPHAPPQPKPEQAPLPMCEKDKNCQLINDTDHQQQFKHTCKIENCENAHQAWHTRCFEHEECIEINEVEGGQRRLQIVGNWEKIKVQKLKSLINKHMSIPVAQQVLRKDGLELSNPQLSCRAYGVKVGCIVCVSRVATAQPPTTPTSTSAHSNGLSNSTPTSPPHAAGANKHLPQSAFAPAGFPAGGMIGNGEGPYRTPHACRTAAAPAQGNGSMAPQLPYHQLPPSQFVPAHMVARAHPPAPPAPPSGNAAATSQPPAPSQPENWTSSHGDASYYYA